MKPSASCPFLRSPPAYVLLLLVLVSSIALIHANSAQSPATIVKLAAERPQFIPCELAQLALGPNGLKIPGVKYFPCTLVRSVKYVSGHYKRGLRMLMKNHRKSLSRNKFLNSIGNKQKSQVMSSMATKIAGNVVARVASTFMKKRQA